MLVSSGGGGGVSGEGSSIAKFGRIGGEAGNCKYWSFGTAKIGILDFQTPLARPVIFLWRCRAVGDGV